MVKITSFQALFFHLYRLFTFFFSFYILLIFNAKSQSILEKGKASYYSNTFDGRKTASGEKYNHNYLTAAHRSLAFGTVLKVTNLKNGKSVIVKINDRGPSSKKRIIDLSYAAAKELDMIKDGIADVKIESVSISDDHKPIISPSKQPGLITEEGYYSKELKQIKRPSGYLLQIGSFSSPENALVRINELKALHYKTDYYIQFVTVKKNHVYRVCGGPFLSEKDVKSSQIFFKKHGYESLILKP